MVIFSNKYKTLVGMTLALSAFLFFTASFCYGAEPKKYEFQKGMCYVTWTADQYTSQAADESLKGIVEEKANWVSILTTWYQDKCYSTTIAPGLNSPTDESIIHAIKDAHDAGFKIMLKPHLDITDVSDGSWRGDIACTREPDWQLWFENYRDFMLHYAKIAEENHVEMLCIGTELTSVATIKEEMWKEIVIKPIRQVYSGQLTYAANWNDEYEHVVFWDALDYVGIDAYFPLNEDKAVPTLEELRKDWEPWVKEMEEFQKKVNKPIIFPEVGYYSADWTAKRPWEEAAAGPVELQLQADCYTALMETFWNKEWFYGVYWWRWGTDPRYGGPNNRGYSLQNKPAAQVVKDWYSKPTPVRKPY